MYEDAKRYVDSGWRDKWDMYFKVYRGERVIRNYEGISNPSIREAHTIIETLVANIAGGNPKFNFIVTNEEQSRDVEALNAMVEYYFLCNQISLKTQEWVRDMLMYGTGVMYIDWFEGKPRLANVAIRDFFVDPTATNKANARYMGYIYFANTDTLKTQKIYDADEDKMVPRYHNLDDIGNDFQQGTDNGDSNQADKQFKDMFEGSTLGEEASKSQIHVILLHDLTTGRIVEIGNKKKFIYNQPTWCQRKEETRTIQVPGPDGAMVPSKQTLKEIKPFLPFAILRDYIDSSQFYGTGEMDLLVGDSELLNDYESMQIDNSAYQNTPMYWIDPQYADLASELETIPGAVYPIPRNAMGSIERPALSTDIDNKEALILGRMRRATAADEAVQGVAQSKSRTTATEVKSQLNQAQTRFSTKTQNLESEGFNQLGFITNKLIQIFVTTKTAQRIVGPMGIYFKDYDPWESDGDYDVNVQLESTIKQKQMEVGQKNNQIYEQLSNDPQGVFNPVEVKRFIIQNVDPNMTDEKFNKMLKPAEAPKETSMDQVIMNYKDMSPFTKYQAEIKAGFEPDPAHMAEIKQNMINMAADNVNRLDQSVDRDGNPIESLLPQPPAAPEGMTA